MIIYTVKTFQGRDGKEKTRWIRIGVATKHKDEKGYSLFLDALPTDGRLVLREEPAPEKKDVSLDDLDINNLELDEEDEIDF